MKGIVITIISMMVMLLVGIIVVQNLVASQDQAGWSTKANDTWDSLQANIWTAFVLLVISPIILGAVAIMAILYRGGGED